MSKGCEQEGRQLVHLPGPIQEHMFGNMRVHLSSSNEMIGHASAGKLDEAVKIAERRLGMSPLSEHETEHMAPLFPKLIQDMESSMPHAGSRLVIVL